MVPGPKFWVGYGAPALQEGSVLTAGDKRSCKQPSVCRKLLLGCRLQQERAARWFHRCTAAHPHTWHQRTPAEKVDPRLIAAILGRCMEGQHKHATLR